MMISYPAPELCQGSDEQFLVAIGRVLFPGFVEQPTGMNGLRLWVDGDPADSESREEVAERFQTLLGALRAKWADTGELRIELLGGLGEGSARDRNGNQWVGLGTAIMRSTFGNEVERFAEDTRYAIQASPNLRLALTLHGGANRTAASLYMIYELASAEFGGEQGISQALGISAHRQDRFNASANNLAPLAGGRHASAKGQARWNLSEQKEFAADLLRSWIRYGAAIPAAVAPSP
jgi:hypothetical protein